MTPRVIYGFRRNKTLLPVARRVFSMDSAGHQPDRRAAASIPARIQHRLSFGLLSPCGRENPAAECLKAGQMSGKVPGRDMPHVGRLTTTWVPPAPHICDEL